MRTPHPIRLARSFKLLTAAALATALTIALSLVLWSAAATPAAAKYTFKMGTPAYEIQGRDCWGTVNNTIGGNVGAQVDRKKKKPKVGDVFYVRLLVTNAGLSCGSPYFYGALALPSGVKAVTSRKYRARCYVSSDFKKWDRFKNKVDGTCDTRFGPTQIVHPRIKKWWSVNMRSGDVWPMPQGLIMRFELPVKSTRAIGTSRSKGCACLVAGILSNQGNSLPSSTWSFSNRFPAATGPSGPLQVWPKAKKKKKTKKR